MIQTQEKEIEPPSPHLLTAQSACHSRRILLVAHGRADFAERAVGKAVHKHIHLACNEREKQVGIEM